jgi:hypothetical protein
MNFRSPRNLLAVGAALAALAASMPAGAAATTTPAAGYEQFAGCPHPGQNPKIVTCVRTVTSGGVLHMGSIEIPIATPMTLSGGMTGAGLFDYNSKGGLSPIKQTVPGGVIGFTGLTWLLEFFSTEALVLRAVIELAGTPGDQLAEPASLPVKVHFVNQVLGNNCYVGSKAEPLELELITGETNPPSPNQPIFGNPGSSSLTGSGITDVTGATYVDNSFAAPGATGCVLTLFGYPPESIDETINAEGGLPAAAGTNETLQEFSRESVSSALVYP